MGIGKTVHLVVRICSPHGLHLRPAAVISRRLKDCPCSVSAEVGDRKANAKSSMELVMLEAAPGEAVVLTFHGKGAKRYRDEFASLVDKDLEIA